MTFLPNRIKLLVSFPYDISNHFELIYIVQNFGSKFLCIEETERNVYDLA